MERNSNQPLVTVAVVTYNSSPFVLETLDSIKAQSYRNIELIVSDDCSQDDTLMVCSGWIEQNKDRFVNAQLLTVPKNTGTSGNANRALKASKGEWIKYIAGDDLLIPSGIEDCVKMTPQGDVFFAEAIHFSGSLSDKKFTYERIDIEGIAFGEKSTAKSQFNILKRQYIGSGPGFFAKRSVIEEVGGFDERFPLMDDYPLFIKIAKNGHKFRIIPQEILYKRVHSSSVSHQKENDAIISSMVVRCVKEYKYQYKYENLNWLWRLFLKYSLFINGMIIDMGNNQKKLSCRAANYIRLTTDPFLWYSRLLSLRDRKGWY